MEGFGGVEWGYAFAFNGLLISVLCGLPVQKIAALLCGSFIQERRFGGDFDEFRSS